MRWPGRSRGGSERQKVLDQMGWSDDYDAEEAWSRVQSPEMRSSRQQKLARLALFVMALSFPASLGACVIAFSATQSDEEVVPTVSVEIPWSPVRTGKAEEGVLRWLRDSGREPVRAVSVEQAESLIQCGGGSPRCEEHVILADMADGQTLRVGAMVHPDDGSFRVSPWLIGTGGEVSAPWKTETRVGDTLGTTWSGNSDYREPLPDDIESTLTRWAKTWVTGTRDDLQALSLLPEKRAFAPMQPGWRYAQYEVVNRDGSTSIVDGPMKIADWVTIVNSASAGEGAYEHLITVMFDVVSDGVDDCFSGESAARLPGDKRPACPNALTISMDVRVVVGEGRLPGVIGYGVPGTGAPIPAVLGDGS